MKLTEKYTMEKLPIDPSNILDYNQHEGFTRLLIGKYPEDDLERAVEIDVLESTEDIDSKMYE